MHALHGPSEGYIERQCVRMAYRLQLPPTGETATVQPWGCSSVAARLTLEEAMRAAWLKPIGLESGSRGGFADLRGAETSFFSPISDTLRGADSWAHGRAISMGSPLLLDLYHFLFRGCAIAFSGDLF